MSANPEHVLSQHFPPSVIRERDFFRAFFAALVENKVSSIDWRADETARRFRRVYQYLRREQSHSPLLPDLVRRLRPDPITGANPALDSALVNLQPTDLSAANPSYERVLLMVPPSMTNQLIEALPEELHSIVREAARIFCQDDI